MKQILKSVIPGRIWHEAKMRLKKPLIGKEKLMLSKHLPNNPVVVEAGAHNGFDTVQMATLWPRGRILAFEPVPEIFKILEKETRYFDNVDTYPYALDTETGEKTIHISSGGSNASSSLLEPEKHLEIHPEIKFDRSLQIQTVLLPDWCGKNGVDHVDFFWLDLQGYELQVLRSCEEILPKTKAIYTEVNTVETYKGGALYEELSDFLKSKGFTIEYEKLEYEEGGNALFVRESSL